MSKRNRWLAQEIEHWLAEGLISKDQAERLRQRYPLPADGPPWGLIVFASAGALVIGLGVILLFAYNWAGIPKYVKLALIFAAVAVAHGAGLRLQREEGWPRKLGEALNLLGTMFYGAGIWLVAQVYHIDEHYPNGFLLWALGALALAWCLDSIAHGLLATVLLAIWGGSETLAFRDPNLWSLVLVIAALGPLAWRLNSALLLAAVVAAADFLLLAHLAHAGGPARTFTAALALSALLIAGARLTRRWRPDFSAGASVFAGFGFAGFLFGCYLLGFRQAADDLLDWNRLRGAQLPLATGLGWSLFGLALLAWLLLAFEALNRRLMVAVEEWLVPLALIYAFVAAATQQATAANSGLIAAIFNLTLLGVAVMWMWRGCNESRLRPTVIGSLLLAAVVLARYFDLFQSLAARGFAFIVLGGIFMAEAMYYRRNRQAAKAATEGQP